MRTVRQPRLHQCLVQSRREHSSMNLAISTTLEDQEVEDASVRWRASNGRLENSVLRGRFDMCDKVLQESGSYTCLFSKDSINEGSSRGSPLQEVSAYSRCRKVVDDQMSLGNPAKWAANFLPRNLPHLAQSVLLTARQLSRNVWFGRIFAMPPHSAVGTSKLVASRVPVDGARSSGLCVFYRSSDGRRLQVHRNACTDFPLGYTAPCTTCILLQVRQSV
ncbi:hypothetical protein EDC04DRAFT_683872 [Pisolithus marmoratus]|nr:hypothetical protein EDC04DRAFT_683872 [Pisolithus marmoratus]